MRRLASPPGWRLARILLALLLACARSIAPARAQTSPASGFAFAPPVAPVLTHTSGPGAEVASTYFFDDFRRYHYVSTRVTTPDSVASGASQLIFQWGEVDPACGGLIAFINSEGTLVFGVNCNTDSDPAKYAYAGQLKANTDYLLEFYYDAKEHVAKIWVDGALESGAITGQLGFNWNDGPISVGMLHSASAPWSSGGTIHEVSFYEWGDARGFAPTCAPVLRHKDGAGSSVRSSHTFDSANKYVYVAARITTGASFSTNGRIFLWGVDSVDTQCGTDAGGGLQAFIAETSGKQAFGVQCSSGSDSPVLETGPGMLTNTEYFLEWMYDTSTGVVKMWRDGELRAEIAGNFKYVDGKLTVGYGHHGDSTVNPFEGTIHDISFYECPRGGSVFPDRAALKAEVDACLLEEPLGRRCGMETWDVSAVTSLEDVFHNAASFDADISGWDVSSVTTMVRTFASATFFNGRLDNWDVSKVTDMEYAFFGTKWFNQPIGRWDVSGVTHMYAMFRDAASFDQYIGDWPTGAVGNMHGMFQRARRFNQALGDWDTAGVVDTAYMFEDATAFNHDITGWGSDAQFAASENMFRRASAWNAIFSRGLDTSTNGPAQHWSLDPQYCGEDERVESNACVACPSGYVNAPGDDKNGGDTTCDSRYCAEDHYLSAGACVACPTCHANAEGDDTRGGLDTTCELKKFACDFRRLARKSTACSRLLERGTTCATCDIGYRLDRVFACDVNMTTCERTLRVGKCSAPCRDFLCLSAPSAPAARAKVAELRRRREEL